MWQEAQRRAQDRLWPEVDRLLAALPPRLFRQARLLQYELALRYAQDGHIAHIFLGPAEAPMLSIGGWLLDDLRSHSSDAEKALFRISVLLVLRAQALEDIADEASFSDHRLTTLVQFCAERVMRELAVLVPATSPFWEAYASISVDDLERQLEARERQESAIPPDDPWAFIGGGRARAAAIVGVAAAEISGCDANVRPILAMLEGLCAAFEARRQLETMHADLLAGRITYPIAVVASAAGIALRPAPRPETVLGAMVATGSLPLILEQALERIRHSRALALDLRLPTFSAYLESVEERFADQARGLGGEAGPSPIELAARLGERPRSEPLLRTAEPSLTTALAMAQGFLLADPTLRESWETHREGMLGAAEVSSRFPAGLILEILCRRGIDLGRRVDDFLAFTAGNRFRYYDHPWSEADTDTLGVFLRLRPFARDAERHRHALSAVLGCLERRVGPDGVIPVWISGCTEDLGDRSAEGRPQAVALGEGCGTVTAHLLLGLLGAGAPELRPMAARGSAQLIDRLCEVGLGVNVNYPPDYALAVFHRLIASAERVAAGLSPDEGPRSAAARALLETELERAARARILTAQQAALVTIACREAGRDDLIRPGWTATMLRQQRFDGGWMGEPFAAAPNRGGWVTWYSSASLTTALCFDALSGHLTAGV